jgi:hypothetical protein
MALSCKPNRHRARALCGSSDGRALPFVCTAPRARTERHAHSRLGASATFGSSNNIIARGALGCGTLKCRKSVSPGCVLATDAAPARMVARRWRHRSRHALGVLERASCCFQCLVACVRQRHDVNLRFSLRAGMGAHGLLLMVSATSPGED